MEKFQSPEDIIAYMEAQRNESQRQALIRFFKTGTGDYGEGDEFLGLKVPQTREVAKIAQNLPLDAVPVLLASRWHEVRLCGLLILTIRFSRLATQRLTDDAASIAARDEIVTMYLHHSEQANNWDLVDLSAPKILGHWLILPTHLVDKQTTVDLLARSDNLWRQRISMVCTLKPTQMGDASWCLRYASMHLHNPHDLMHKAVGWMLREMGKHVSMDLLRDFLDQHLHEMSRTTLRYAIEKMSDREQRYWLKAI